MLFQSWHELARIAIVAATLFVITVALLRLVGQQTLARMSGYDVILTVSLGSILATVALTPNMTIAGAVTALLTFVLLQEATRFLQSRLLFFHHLVRERPSVILWNGELLEERLKENRVSADEVRSAVRKMGLASLSQAQAVVLENDGEWSVVPKRSEPSDDSAFHGLEIPGSEKAGEPRPRTASPRRIP